MLNIAQRILTVDSIDEGIKHAETMIKMCIITLIYR